MNQQELIAYCQPVQVTGSVGTEPKRLVADSRKVEPGDMFVAIRGTGQDGHRFLRQAVEAGAGVLIVEQPDEQLPDNVLQIQVRDTREICGRLAQAMHGHPAQKLRLAGVTGTNGKTTVITLVHQVLEKLGHKPGMLSTIETRVGDRTREARLTTPDAIELAALFREMADRQVDVAVMEVSSHALDQRRTAGLRYDVAGFTNLSHDHMDYHDDIDAYAAAKKRLFDGLDDDAVAVVNMDDERGGYMVRNTEAEVWEFGFENVPGIHILQKDSEGLVIDVDGTLVQSPLVGRFNAYNVVQAYLICRALGCSKSNVAAALAHATGAPGRLEKVTTQRKGGQPLVLVDYAHSPGALENVMATICEVKSSGEKLHVVFGAGGDRDTAKRPQMAQVAERMADRITVTSDNPRSEDPRAIIDDILSGFSDTGRVQTLPDRKEAIRQAVSSADAATIVLIAGKGHETYQEVQGEHLDMDDREIARVALQRRAGSDSSESEVPDAI